MRWPENRDPKLVVTVTALLVLLISIAAGIPSGEGFNPSDDGAVLAQSYRILNGEVPHRDFISIRPAGSGFLHSIHFLSPLPLELSARWFVLVQYFLTSMFLVTVLMGSWFRGLRKWYYHLLLAGSLLVTFVLNQNHYNLFPWTTVDALFFFSLSLYAWYKSKLEHGGSKALWRTLVVMGAVLSALCRQTFLLPAILIVARLVYWELRNDGFRVATTARRLLPALAIGCLPGIGYAAMLTFGGGWKEFFIQLSGRTELWETGVVRFHEIFWQFPVWAAFSVVLLTGLLKVWESEAGHDVLLFDQLLMGFKVASFIAKIILGFLVFTEPARLFGIALVFFWLLVLDILLVYFQEQQLPRWIRPALWVLLASWTSAISLGDNSPVFALGWLASTAMMLQIRDFWSRIYRRVRPFQLIAAAILVPALVVLSVKVQKEINYRDLPSKELTRKGGELFDGLKGIRLSAPMYDYLGEIRDLYREYGSPRGRFAVLPNNALIYSLLDSPNPFPADWLQAAEFPGSGERVLRAMKESIETAELVILIEKDVVKWIASDTVIPVRSRPADYPWLQLVDSLAARQESGSRYFEVFRTK